MRHELLGLRIDVEGDATAPIVRALAPLAAPGALGPADLVFAAATVDAPRALPARAVFVHSPVTAGLDGGALVLGDGSARFVVAPGGARIDAELTPAALKDPSEVVTALHAPVALAFALRHRCVFHLHAATLVLPGGDRAVLLPGETGSGKTTLAIALLEAGLGPVGDDATYLAERGGALRVQGLARPFHLRPATLRAFPRVAALAGPADAQGRSDLDSLAAWGPGPRAPVTPGLLLFPEIAPRAHTAVTPLSQGEALGRLIEASALLMVDGAARVPEHLALLGRLASEAPAFGVALGEDLLSAPRQVVATVLRAAAGPAEFAMWLAS